MNIEDGQGTGYKAGVNEDNQLRTLAITRSMEHYSNQKMMIK